jgi:prevent-host-death family protein
VTVPVPSPLAGEGQGEGISDNDAIAEKKKVTAMQQVDLDQAKMHLLDLIEAAGKGEEIVITKDNHPVAKLVPVSRAKLRPQFGSAAGLITIADDFNEPLADFGEYMK